MNVPRGTCLIIDKFQSENWKVIVIVIEVGLKHYVNYKQITSSQTPRNYFNLQCHSCGGRNPFLRSMEKPNRFLKPVRFVVEFQMTLFNCKLL